METTSYETTCFFCLLNYVCCSHILQFIYLITILISLIFKHKHITPASGLFDYRLGFIRTTVSIQPKIPFSYHTCFSKSISNRISACWTECCRTSTSYRMHQQQHATSSATQTPTGLSTSELESVKCVKYKASSSECDAISCSICLSKLKYEEEV